jgi:hypothetical protein
MGYDGLRRAALEWDAVQQTRIKIGNMLKAFDRLQRPYPEGITDWLGNLEQIEVGYLNVMDDEARTGEPWLRAVHGFLQETAGLGPAVLCILGLVPQLPAFCNPAKLWAYLGLAVLDGAAVKVPNPPPPNNPRGPKGSHFSRRIRAYATRRVVDPIIRNMQSAYRGVYDGRRLHTGSTHAEWALERNKAGVLTPAGHYHNDAIRYTAKRIWRDIWNVANGRHSPSDTQSACAPIATPTL